MNDDCEKYGHCWHYNDRWDMDRCCECFLFQEAEEVY